jgi:RNA polymerase-binding transcription factor DksA
MEKNNAGLSQEFVQKQAGRIQGRINKYLNRKRIQEELRLQGNVSDYIIYKQNQVLPHLKAALSRINNGTYGVCLECGEIIEEPRLKMVPGAELCIKCVQKKKK